MYELPTGTVTLLLTDIEGSTRLLQQVGDRYGGVLAECRHLLRGLFQQWHGHEVDTQGDAFFVAFERATDAVAAAAVAQRALFSHAWPAGTPLRVRMGLHTGEPQRTAEGYVGLDVHLAARIMSAGHGGQVLLSQTTRDLVAGALPEGVRLLDLGVHRLKDLPQPSQLFQLVIAGIPAAFPPLKTLDRSPNNLPVQPSPFIGREQEMDAVGQLLRREEIQLVTLTGPGGVGKTRLALQVAGDSAPHFAGGTWFVSLASISDPDLVIPTISQTLGLRAAPGQSPLEHLQAYLRDKQVLLLLDNFEHVVSAAIQVAELLTHCPRLTVLVTSREGLHLRAEREFPVPPLALPDVEHLPDLEVLSQNEAVALFITRAQAVKPDFQLSKAKAGAVVEICARLDGLPLAIELAAARIKLLPPDALLARLGQRLAVLTGGTRDAPARQQTLRDTIEWSYHLLDASEQQLFRRLAVFVGGCTLEAVEVVCAVAGSEAVPVLDRVGSLIDKSLLQQTEQQDGEVRLVMLETIREYGLEALETSGEMEDTRRAHAAYNLRLAEEAEPELGGSLQTVWLERLEREHENLRAALQWSLDPAGNEETRQRREMALRLAGALRQFWLVRGHWKEGRAFLERALAAGKGSMPSSRVKALTAAADLALQQGDTDRGEMLCEESLALCQELGDRAGIAHLLSLQGKVAFHRNKLAAARSLFEESLALWRKVGDKNGIGLTLYRLAWLAKEQGEYARARALCEESLTTHRESGNQRGLADALSELAEILFAVQSDQGAVRALLEESLALSREMGDKENMAICFFLLGGAALQQSDSAAARSFAEQSLELFKEMGDQGWIAQSLALLGKVNVVQGDYTAARALYEESLTFPLGGDASSLEGLAGVVAAQGELTWAARLWGATEALREAICAPRPPFERVRYERAVAAVRAQLGEKAFAAAWAQGQKMTPEQVLAEQVIPPRRHLAV
jgi:predicted ATPase/class 3 adenylate cyclase